MPLKLGSGLSPLRTAQYRGVLDINDPYLVPPTFLRKLRNGYISDSGGVSGKGGAARTRPGFVLQNPGAALGDPSTDETLARSGWTPSASDETLGDATNSIDGNAATVWGAEGPMSFGHTYFEIDTGVKQRLGRLVADFTAASGAFPRAGDVQLSSDGSLWETVATWGLGDVFPIDTLDISWTPALARYVRLLAQDNPVSGSDWKIAEVDLYANGKNGGGYGQASAWAAIADGTIYNYIVANGRLFQATGLSDWTDVTPSNIVIDQFARVYLTPFSNRLVVNDGVNTPWVASNLGSSPVTGTLIDYTGNGLPWVAYGRPVVWQDSLFFVVRTRDSTGVDEGTPENRTARIGWSEVDDPFSGYFQGKLRQRVGPDRVRDGTNLCPRSDQFGVALHPRQFDRRHPGRRRPGSCEHCHAGRDRRGDR